MHINKKKGLLYLFILLAIAGAGYSYFRPKDEMMYITEPVEIKDVRKVVNATGEIKDGRIVSDTRQTTEFNELKDKVQDIKRSRISALKYRFMEALNMSMHAILANKSGLY